MPRRLLIQVRRDSLSNWSSANPILDNGEFGHELNTNKIKIGDGTTLWNSLPYAADIKSDNAVLDRILRDSPGTSVIGRAENSAGDPGNIRAFDDGTVLKRTGSNLGFQYLVTDSFADSAIISSKILNNTIRDIDISPYANISPSKLGPGILSTRNTVTTENYIERSIEVDKLSRLPNEEGIAVWLPYLPRAWTIHPVDSFSGGGWSYGGFLGNGYNGSGSWVDPTSSATPPNVPFGGENNSGTIWFIGSADKVEFRNFTTVYSKYAVINNTCYVNGLFNLTNEESYYAVLVFSLPIPAKVPNETILGSAYHLRNTRTLSFLEAFYQGTRTRGAGTREMAPIIPVANDNKYVTFFSHKNPSTSYIGGDDVRSYYYVRMQAPDRVSFSLRYEI